MPRRRQTTTGLPPRTAPPESLRRPVLRDWVTAEEFDAAQRANGGRTLAELAEPRWRQAVDEWFRQWCASFADGDPQPVDSETSQAAAMVYRDDEDHKLVLWARGVVAGHAPRWSPR